MSAGRWRAGAVPACLLAAGLVFFGKGVWIYGKAALAQQLLNRAWSRTVSGGKHVKPWPWADTWPIAKIEIPRAGGRSAAYIVLSGASGRTLAFGPGHLDGSATPGSRGNCVLSAHRDTQFEALRGLVRGDSVVVQTPDGKRHVYRVASLAVVDRRDTRLLEATEEESLTLVTCYPFDAVVPGGPLRLVVRAVAL
jgi:sortase A